MTTEATFEKLRQIRTRTDLTLPVTRHLRSEIVGVDGSPTPLVLRTYQKQMVAHLIAMTRFVVGDDTGLGKTLETITALAILWDRTPAMKVIVLTKKSAIHQWRDEFDRFTTGVSTFVADGSPSERETAHREWLAATGPAVLLQGYTSIGNDLTRVQGWSGYVLVTDEATVYKTPTTRTHKVCRHLADRASRVWALTATMIKNTLMEGYGICRVVVPELFPMTPPAFMRQFCIVQLQRVARNRQVQVIVGYRDLDVVKFREIVFPYYLGRPKHEVASELPTLITREVVVGLTDFQRRKYKEATDGIIELGDGTQKETDPLTSLIYWQEVVDHPGLIGFPNEGSEKLDALVDLLTDELAGDKVIVFTRFRKMVDIGMAVLEKEGIPCVRVTGTEDAEDRRDAMKAFQDPKSPTRVIWITMAGGDSINLQAARAIVFYDSPWSAGDYLQVLGRLLRIGSVHESVLALILVGKGTIDTYVSAVLKKKMRLVEAVLGRRLKGEADDVTFDGTSEVREIYDAVLADARKSKGSGVIDPL